MYMFTFRTKASLVAVALTVMAVGAQAQIGVQAGPAPLAAHSSAAELNLDGTWQASLLRFGEANKAWKFGADVDIERQQTAAGGTTVSATTFTLAGSIGRRSYSGTGRFRPFTGFGASLGYQDLNTVSIFSVGPYAEIGGAYFVTDRFSVSGASTGTFLLQNVSPDGGTSTTNFAVRGRLMTMMATIYF